MSNFSRNIGFAIDIDGVIVRGKNIIDIAIIALKLLIKKKIPFVLLTNGGGITEEKKASDLTHKLGIEILSSQIILSHTPFKKLINLYENKKVLILGNHDYINVALNYGFKNIITTEQIHQKYPSIFPHKLPYNNLNNNKLHNNKLNNNDNCDLNELQEIAAAIIIYEPVDWALDMQILTDVLIGNSLNNNNSNNNNNNLLNNKKQKIPLYACNADVVYMDVHHHPRYTQGAFVTAFKGLFDSYTGDNLTVEYCGKPFEIQYKLAEELICNQMKLIHNNFHDLSILPNIFYGIGDNPKSDIRGANNAGDHWNSVLVKTGVFQGDKNDEIDIADIVTDNLYTALEIIFAKHFIVL